MAFIESALNAKTAIILYVYAAIDSVVVVFIGLVFIHLHEPSMAPFLLQTALNRLPRHQ